MKYIKIFEEYSNKDLIITIPKSINWDGYQKELSTVADGKQVMNYKVRSFPKVNIGAKCYLVYDGFIRGWMTIVGMSEKEFTCSTTGKKWVGKFIERSGKFHTIEPIKMQGFRGYKYFNL